MTATSTWPKSTGRGGNMANIFDEDELMVDPPSGWMYGFPALWDKKVHPKLEDLLREKKYPEKDIDFACQYLRVWRPTDEH